MQKPNLYDNGMKTLSRETPSSGVERDEDAQFR
jgi:hypothetical protein